MAACTQSDVCESSWQDISVESGLGLTILFRVGTEDLSFLNRSKYFCISFEFSAIRLCFDINSFFSRTTHLSTSFMPRSYVRGDIFLFFRSRASFSSRSLRSESMAFSTSQKRAKDFQASFLSFDLDSWLLPFETLELENLLLSTSSLMDSSIAEVTSPTRSSIESAIFGLL